MPKLMVTWLGEDELHDPLPGPSFTTWGNTRFDKGKPTLVDSDTEGVGEQEKLILAQIVLKAPKNRFFKVEPVTEKQSKGQADVNLRDTR